MVETSMSSIKESKIKIQSLTKEYYNKVVIDSVKRLKTLIMLRLKTLITTKLTLFIR